MGQILAMQRTVTTMKDDRLKQCKCCTNFINANCFDEEPWCRVKPYHQMPKTKPGEGEKDDG